ncbi:bis(5'-adenosyl)-triphosphatase ENPP4-like [Biomphalaria glabrata]|uniref:Bis(5'-adenosyl)-triphosphatase ENPP4-like n=1 Tax=Biomphalaria glabrata TaxID=6526 RepID=A0A9U8ECM8_BIOGL|nr:bis(5'-adenosyl)-triphosphatase ENPP4-like [Biomphalaria glabrata]XP_013081888.2 bis(5'-adenosyl)-triphosphatase ENPP4-like [Biomphalaria glabrata]
MSCKVVLSMLLLCVMSWRVDAKSKVLLVSMDGFRHDYLTKTTNVTNFTRLINAGVTMPYMNTSFVTKTFPCHYSMVTGLHPEVHGIISNRFYDPDENKTFSLKNTEPFWWENGEPIWITAVKSNLKAGVFFWPGSETELQGKRATQWRKYNSSVPFEQRVTTVVQWLADDNFDLALLYFNEPDSTGHAYGPDSQPVVETIEKMDSILGHLLRELERNGLKNKVNLIVTSDHGMSDVDLEHRLIDISELVDDTLLSRVVDEGPTANLIPEPNKAKELVEALSSVEHLHVMLKENIPERFHLKNNKRVMPVFAYADEGWLIVSNVTTRKMYPLKGDHGYDNDLSNMKPFFLASGPDFQTGGKRVDPIQNVDIYPLICHLLDIPTAPNNGSLNRTMNLLRSKPSNKGINLQCSLVLLLIHFYLCSKLNYLP